MPIEAATFIKDLNASNPTGTDQIKDGDNHVRLVKSVLKNTFPNLDAQVSLTPLELNQAKFTRGMIMMWSGLASATPDGWALCDGGTYPKSDASGNVTVPNLVGRFIKGSAGGSGDLATPTGGSSTHTHTATVAATALTAAQIPAHTHPVTDAGHTHTGTTASDPGHTHDLKQLNLGGGAQPSMSLNGTSTGALKTELGGAHSHAFTTNSSPTGVTVGANTGGGGTHTHDATVASASSEPQFYLMAFIYKL